MPTTRPRPRISLCRIRQWQAKPGPSSSAVCKRGKDGRLVERPFPGPVAGGDTQKLGGGHSSRSQLINGGQVAGRCYTTIQGERRVFPRPPTFSPFPGTSFV